MHQLRTFNKKHRKCRIHLCRDVTIQFYKKMFLFVQQTHVNAEHESGTGVQAAVQNMGTDDHVQTWRLAEDALEKRLAQMRVILMMKRRLAAL